MAEWRPAQCLRQSREGVERQVETSQRFRQEGRPQAQRFRSTPQLVEEYLCEAEATRRRGFATIGGDRELSQEIAVPAGGTRTLFDLILETLARASHRQGRAFATFRLFSDARLPHI